MKERIIGCNDHPVKNLSTNLTRSLHTLTIPFFMILELTCNEFFLLRWTKSWFRVFSTLSLPPVPFCTSSPPKTSIQITQIQLWALNDSVYAQLMSSFSLTSFFSNFSLLLSSLTIMLSYESFSLWKWSGSCGCSFFALNLRLGSKRVLSERLLVRCCQSHLHPLPF